MTPLIPELTWSVMISCEALPLLELLDAASHIAEQSLLFAWFDRSFVMRNSRAIPSTEYQQYRHVQSTEPLNGNVSRFKFIDR